MKGLIFTEFMEMVETVWSLDMVDRLIDRSQVASGGIYTAVGDYPHTEMLALIKALSDATGTPVEQLEQTFGKYLFGRFALLFPHYLSGVADCFQFLAGIEDIIHAVVNKRFPDAEPPVFMVATAPAGLSLTYFSERPLVHLVQGFIEGCISHFGGHEVVQREPPPPDQSGAAARFLLTRPA